MTEVVIDGIQYVPSSDFNETLKVMEDVLKSQEYLSDSAIENIIKSLKNSMDKPSKTGEVSLKNLGKSTSKTGEVLPENLGKSNSKSQGSSKMGRPYASFKYYGCNKRLFSIEKVYHDGTVLYNQQGIAKWKIQQAIIIKDNMNNGSSKGLTNEDIRDISQKVKLSTNMVRTIMYNIEHGDLSIHIGKWRLEYVTNAPTRQPRPIENNPQKRKESGIYG